MADSTSRRRRLSAEDWTAAALSALTAGGIDAVAVEPIARTLGATKGSFYWHFANRRELIERALASWEADHTDAVIAATGAHPDPLVRIDRLLAAVLENAGDPLELALSASLADPSVAEAVARVTERRIAHVADLYRAAGLEPQRARSAALTAVATYLGHAQLVAAAPGTLPVGAERRRHIARVRKLLAP